jgi:predicted nucleotidyltransferase
MRKNRHLINKSDVLSIIVEKIEASYSEDISLLICYGSYVTGEYAGMSDIDFFFVPKTNRGYKLGHQFILNNIGYDLWPVSWGRLNNISNLEDQPASILIDGKVLFASSTDDLRKLDDLRNNFKQNLSNDAVVRKMSTKYVERAKAIYFGLQNHESEVFFVEAINAVEALLIAIAILNGTYIKKGLKKIENELDRLPMVPAGFLENHSKMIRTNNKTKVQQIVNIQIVEREKIWKSKFNPDKKKVDPSEMVGFYEEFKSTYNKLLLACDEKDYENAYYAAFMIDRETQLFLTSYTGSGIFPNLIKVVLRNDFDIARANCLEHERRLIKLLNANEIRINTYKDRIEFRQRFIAQTT